MNFSLDLFSNFLCKFWPVFSSKCVSLCVWLKNDWNWSNKSFANSQLTLFALSANIARIHKLLINIQLKMYAWRIFSILYRANRSRVNTTLNKLANCLVSKNWISITFRHFRWLKCFFLEMVDCNRCRLVVFDFWY